MGIFRILIADDKALVRSGLRILLERHGGWVICGEAADGMEALEKAVDLKPDVILLDISMPKLDGLAAMPLLREKMPHTAIVVLTMHQSLEMARIAANAGAIAFITKSLLVNELVPTLEGVQAQMNLAEPTRDRRRGVFDTSRRE